MRYKGRRQLRRNYQAPAEPSPEAAMRIFGYRGPDPDDEDVLPDPSYCTKGLDMWGIGFAKATNTKLCYPKLGLLRNPGPSYGPPGLYPEATYEPLSHRTDHFPAQSIEPIHDPYYAWPKPVKGMFPTGSQGRVLAPPKGRFPYKSHGTSPKGATEYLEAMHAPAEDFPANLPPRGLTMSHNEKTIVSISQHQDGTCTPSEICDRICYGYGVRFVEGPTPFIMRSNRHTFRWLGARKGDHFVVPQSTVDEIADAIITKCRHYVDAAHKNSGNIRPGEESFIRWNGIGDLTPGQIRLIATLIEDPTFTVWGFTRRPDMLAPLPIQDNLCFSMSIDESMHRPEHGRPTLRAAVRAAQEQGTGLAYASTKGLRCDNSIRYNRDGTIHRKVYKNQPNPVDEYLYDLYEGRLAAERQGVPLSVAFGYHGEGVLTRLSVEEDRGEIVSAFGAVPECPATDPFGGGHFFGVCYSCGWCRTKNHLRESADLTAHRENTQVQRYPDGKWTYLDDGSYR